MIEKALSGTTEISDEGIKKHFKNAEPWAALFELTWNGLDAGATNIRVDIIENDLGGVQSIDVIDNGEGIDIDHIEDNFGRFNDSSKKSDMALHGSHGRGRLAFHRLANRAAWWTRFSEKDAVIEIRGDNIKRFTGEFINATQQHHSLAGLKSGTVVKLESIHTSLPRALDLTPKFSIEFGWFLALNKERSIKINDTEVPVPPHSISEKSIPVNGTDFSVKVILWHEKPTSEKSHIYLLDSAGKVRYKQLSSFNLKANFFVSIFVQSVWADNFDPDGDDLFKENTHSLESDEWRKLSGPLYNFVEEIYENFLRDFVESELAKYEDDGVFPSYAGLDAHYAKWRLEHTRNLVKLVYMSDPSVMNSLNKKQKKIIVRLLDRLSVSNENDALYEIISEVLDLEESSLQMLSKQLKHTQLEHIISTIELLQQRMLAVDKLRQLMNEHYREVLETPDLQQIIENNTWLFGNQYETIGAEEDTFTSVARGLRNTLKGVLEIGDEDVEDTKDLAGVHRQTDLFLARKIPTCDSLGNKYYRCIVIEIKRPGIALNSKHLNQLDEYAAIIKRHPAFASEHLRFELILVGRKISDADFLIKSRLHNNLDKGEMGLVGSDPGMKRYVMNWYTLLDGFELSHVHLLKTLELRRDKLAPTTSDELVKELQAAH